MEVKVYECPHCGAPLPPSGLDATVKCTSCGEQTTLDSGSDAVFREEKSRREAEALFERLGHAPRWSQRVAVRLVDWRIWIFGFPFFIGILVQIGERPRAWIAEGYEHFFHARMLHVMSPVLGWLATSIFIVTIILGLLIWSLLGERVDSRRDLQAMLAAKPPKTEGGAARCRKCDAPLEVTAGRLGALRSRLLASASARAARELDHAGPQV